MAEAGKEKDRRNCTADIVVSRSCECHSSLNLSLTALRVCINISTLCLISKKQIPSAALLCEIEKGSVFGAVN